MTEEESVVIDSSINDNSINKPSADQSEESLPATTTENTTSKTITNSDSVEIVGENEIDKPDESSPSVALPLARVKRIIKQDDEIVKVGSSAVYAIAAATELFVQYFAERAALISQSNWRKKVTYQDVAQAVSQNGELEFLSSLVPHTVPFKSLKSKEPFTNAPSKKGVGKGQTTLTGITKAGKKSSSTNDPGTPAPDSSNLVPIDVSTPTPAPIDPGTPSTPIDQDEDTPMKDNPPADTSNHSASTEPELDAQSSDDEMKD